MKKQILRALCGVALVPLCGSLSAVGQTTIFFDNLDANATGTATAGYSFGDVANNTSTFLAGAGVGGSIGAVMKSDFIPPGVGYGGVAFQYQIGNVGGLNTSANLSDYTLSFDAEVNKANGGFGLTFQTWAGTGFSGAFGSSGSASDITLATPNVFQHFTVNLGTLSAGATPTGQTWQLAFQMDEYTYGGVGTGNQLVIDNVGITMAQTPEPTTLVLGGLGAASLLFLRRRKA